MSYSAHNPNLYRWKRFTKPKSVKKKNEPKDDDIRTWIAKVEAATDSAIKHTFSNGDRAAHHRYRHAGEGDVAQIMSDIHDYEDAHTEAQELVSDWINEKIRYDFLTNDEDDDMLDGYDERSNSGLTSGIETATHEKWYEDSELFLQKYLDSSDQPNKGRTKNLGGKNDILGHLDIYEADENTVVKALMKNMMEKPLITPTEIKKEINADKKRKTKFRDPKITMEMRQKEVKEARLRRQKEEERKKQERIIKKEAKFKAQQILKEEEMRKELREKQEEKAIQAEMAKLRKEMLEQRKRDEKERNEKEKQIAEAKSQEDQDRFVKRQEMERKEREKQKEKILAEISRLEDKEKKVAEVIKKRNMENRRLMQTCFSTWCKVVLNQRVKLGKAKAMSDWKTMQRVWAAWKSYTRNQKLDEETKYHQANVREARLKEKVALDCARLRSMRKAFFIWKVFVKAELERKEILKQRESTKAKMQALINAVTAAKDPEEDQTVLQSIESQDNVDDLPHFKTQKPKTITSNVSEKGKNPSKSTRTGMPKQAWQVTKKDVHRLQADEMRHIPDSQTPQIVKSANPGYDPYQNRHKFQKELIDQQRMLLQEQKRMIEDMQEQRRINSLQKEIAMLKEQKKELETNGPTTAMTHNKEVDDKPVVASDAQDTRQVTPRAAVTKKHPIVSKMEERAAERAKRKKELEEIKKKREEEKRRMKIEEEERKQREEEEKKMKELQERKDAKRLQKKLEQEKKAAQERMRDLCKQADNHYTKSLLKHHGFLPWRKLVDAIKQKQEVAEFHHRTVLLKKALSEWRLEVERVAEERQAKADSLYRIILLRRGMRSWKKYGERMDILEQKAIIHHNKVLKKHYLKYWVDYTTDEKLSQWRKESRADDHNRLRMLRRVFNVIRSYRQLVKRETDRRQRLNEMRKKVTQLLPDFQCTNQSLASDVFQDDEEN